MSYRDVKIRLIVIFGHTNCRYGIIFLIALSKMKKVLEVISMEEECNVVVTVGFGKHFN